MCKFFELYSLCRTNCTMTPCICTFEKIPENIALNCFKGYTYTICNTYKYCFDYFCAAIGSR